MGFLKWAFVFSFYYLLRHKKYTNQDIYYDSLRQVIQEGGDTDTNACIVGGMIGALVGVKKLPEHMLKKLLLFDCTRDGMVLRPEFLSVKKYGLDNIAKLIACRPQKDQAFLIK
jgi:hypothetical protein